MNAAAQFARESGYTGSSPAMLAAFEAIRQHGITEARAQHFERKALVDQYAREPGMFFAAIRPSLSTAEAIEDANRIIFGFRRLETWQQAKESRQRELVKAKLTRVIARFFRRYGRRIWINQEIAA